MSEQVVTVSSEVFDRTTQMPGWAVVGTYAMGAQGDPVCIEYRVRVLRGNTSTELLVNLHLTLDVMEGHATESLVGEGAFPSAGIPRYVFEAASQGKLIEKARASLARNSAKRDALSDEARQLLAPPARKPGRPPVRSVAEKLHILAAVEVANSAGIRLDDVAAQFHMSRSALRDLLSWARHDASPRLFEGSGAGRKGGGMTAEARQILAAMEGGDRG